MVEPASEPKSPTTAKAVAQGHFTLCSRQWPTRLTRALIATAAAEVPMATWVSVTPTA